MSIKFIGFKFIGFTLKFQILIAILRLQIFDCLAMIQRGMRTDKDSEVLANQQRVTFNLNRKRGAFEKDMDSLLFGGPTMKSKQLKKSQISSKISTSLQKHQNSVKKKPSIEKYNQSASIAIAKSLSFTQKVTQKSFDSSSSLNKSLIEVNSSKKLENGSLKSSKVSKPSSVTIIRSQVSSKILGQRQKSQIFTYIEDSRPNYIRKYKQVSEVDNFSEQNSKQHKFIDVLRPVECSRNYASRLSCPNFKDKQFPASKISLGVQLQDCDISWKRYEQCVKNATLGKYIDPNDIKKGPLSSSKFISVLGVLAEREEDIKRLIEDQHFSPNQGMYFVRLFINSVWRYFVVDSYVPLLQDSHAGVISYDDNESDMWAALIEKAYAKAFNGYEVFKRPQPREYYFRDLVGAPISNQRIDNPEILNIVSKALQSKKIVNAVLKNNIFNLGINPNCSLTVLNVNKKGGLSLRYNWPLVHNKPQIPISKQGVFNLSDTQLSEFLSYITIVHVNRSYFTTTIQTRHEKQFYVAYKVIIKQTIHGYFTITQFDERLFPKDSYVYQPARLFIHKKFQENKYEYIKGGFSHRERNLDVQVELSPGEYHIFAFINWNQNVYDFNLTFYGSKQLNLVKIPTLKNHNFISLGLQNYNLQYGKRSALGHVHQFISYHQQTNLILITVVNTSTKKYKYLNDLQKNNFQSLHLMNLINNEDNALENLNKQELQAYKSSALLDRKWQIDMEPQETFTWVISSTQNYDPNNYKNWGFR